MKGRRTLREEVVAEYLSGDESYRELALRHGLATSTLHRWVKVAELGEGKGDEPSRRSILGGEGEAAGELRRLRAELEKARLHNKLLNTMIDIAEEQMGVSIRKKHGARR